MAPNTTSLTDQSPNGDGKPIPLTPADKIEEEETISEDEFDSEDDEEDEIDGKSIALPSPIKAEEETDSEDDDEEEQTTAFPPSHSLSQSIAIQNNVSDSKSDSAAFSDSGASPSNYIKQPIPKPLNTITEKRSHAEMTDNLQSSPKSNKKLKLNVKEKKIPATAIAWGNEDEETLLRGMFDYTSKKGVGPKSDFDGFYDSIKEKFQVVRSREQLKNKIRNMRKRFIGIMNRRVNDSDPVFSKPHECLVFDLSKKVWGDDEIFSNDPNKMVPKANSKRNNVKEKKTLMVSYEKCTDGDSFWSKYLFLSSLLSTGFSSVEFSKMKDKMSLIGSEVAKEIDDKCKQLFIEEFELKGKMADLVRDFLKRDG